MMMMMIKKRFIMYNKSRPNIVLYEHFFLPFRLYVIIWTGQKKSRNKVESSFIHSDWMSLTLEYIDIFEGKNYSRQSMRMMVKEFVT